MEAALRLPEHKRGTLTRNAQCPLVVRLTTVITTPGWLRSATSGPDGWNRAAAQIAERVTGGYRPSTADHDAFARLLLIGLDSAHAEALIEGKQQDGAVAQPGSVTEPADD